MLINQRLKLWQCQPLRPGYVATCRLHAEWICNHSISGTPRQIIVRDRGPLIAFPWSWYDSCLSSFIYFPQSGTALVDGFCPLVPPTVTSISTAIVPTIRQSDTASYLAGSRDLLLQSTSICSPICRVRATSSVDLQTHKSFHDPNAHREQYHGCKVDSIL